MAQEPKTQETSTPPKLQISPALLAEVRRLELKTRRSIDADFAGKYRSAFRGTGLLYSDIREYQPGDDVKHIHWKVSARTNRIYVKSYEEDRQLTIILAVDVSNSTSVGVQRSGSDARARSKHLRAVEFAALVSILAQRNQDSIGLCLFSDRVHEYYPPKRTRSQFQRVISTLLQERELPKATNVASALSHISKYQKRSAIVFVISDFISPPFEQELRMLSAQHDPILVALEDQLDRALPSVGIVEFNDAESGRRILVDTSQAAARDALKSLHEKRMRHLSEIARTCKSDFIRVDQNPVAPLSQLMRARTAKLH